MFQHWYVVELHHVLIHGLGRIFLFFFDKIIIQPTLRQQANYPQENAADRPHV